MVKHIAETVAQKQSNNTIGESIVSLGIGTLELS
jgi:hypothetical protein